MQVQVDIEFDQFIQIIKNLPPGKLKMLKDEIEKKVGSEKGDNLKNLLLNGPVATKKQIETIENNRKSINQWRTI